MPRKMDPADWRPPCPQIYCKECSRRGLLARPDKYESTGLHSGFSGEGVLLIRVNCHGAQQDMACSFRWLRDNGANPIYAFDPQMDDMGLLGLKDVPIGLPKGLRSQFNLKEPAAAPEAPKDPSLSPPPPENPGPRAASWL